MKPLCSLKKIAAPLLFVIIVLTGFINQTVASEGQPLKTSASKTPVATPVIDSMGIYRGYASGPGSPIFGGGSLSLLADYGNRQMLSMVLQAKDGTLIVIDGGWEDDSSHLLDVLKSKGGHVSGWFLTHPHSDHVGALIDILNNHSANVTIDNVYYYLAGQAFYDEHGEGRGGYVNRLRGALLKLPPDRLHGDMQKGREIQLGEIRAQVMNTPYLLNETSINNSCVVYKIYLNGITIMVLGDLGPEGDQLLLNDLTPHQLKSDIVQMAHHGQYGVNRDVYAAINPTIALWPCPGWLMDDDNGGGKGSGPWKTLETRRWMEELGVRLNFCTKDGDQVIY